MQRYATCLAAVVFLAVPAWAQTRTGSKLQPPDLDRYLRWGPLRVRPLVEVDNLGYDDNIFSNTQNPVSDITATIAPSVDGLILLGSRGFFEFNEKIEYNAFLENRDQNYLNQLGDGRLTIPFRRIGFYVDFRLDRVEERPQDRQDLRRKRDTDGFGAGIIVLPGHRTEVEIGGETSHWTYRDKDVDPLVLADELDRVESGTTLAARYDLRGRAWLTLDVKNQAIEFDNPLVVPGEIVRDTNQWTTLGGVQFGETGPLRGAGRVGWTDINPDDPRLPDFTEIVGDARIDYRLNPRVTLTGTARREASFSTSSDTNYFLIGEYGVRYLHYVSRILGVELGTTIGRLTFPYAPVTSLQFGRKDDISRYELALRLRVSENNMGKRMEYRIAAGKYRRDSNRDAYDISRNTFGLGLVLGF